MNILEKIIAQKRRRVEEEKKKCPQKELEKMLQQSSPPLDFTAALAAPGLSLIAEFKRASPSRGLISSSSCPHTVARAYQQGGAAAISVLTEEDFFRGSSQDLQQVRQAVDLPILAKDFFLTPYQIYRAFLSGADAILLIAAVLEDGQLKDLYSLAGDLGLAVLLEVHHKDELERVCKVLTPKILGLNNRDLTTMTVDLMSTLSLVDLIPPGPLVVSESGIRRLEDVLLLEKKGLDAILVGEALMTGTPISRLLGGKKNDTG